VSTRRNREEPHILRLPAELRDQIYQEVFWACLYQGYDAGSDPDKPRPDWRFLLTCRQIYTEADNIPARTTTISLDSPFWDETGYYETRREEIDDWQATVSRRLQWAPDGITFVNITIPYTLDLPRLKQGRIKEAISMESGLDYTVHTIWNDRTLLPSLERVRVRFWWYTWHLGSLKRAERKELGKQYQARVKEVIQKRVLPKKLRVDMEEAGLEVSLVVEMPKKW
jgi:hypothetical protein